MLNSSGFLSVWSILACNSLQCARPPEEGYEDFLKNTLYLSKKHMVAKTRQLLKPNTSRRAQCMLAIWFVVLLFFAFRASVGQDVTFYDQLNPTGDPIGGGVGYSAIVSEYDANYLVSDKSGLLTALQDAEEGDIIYVADNAKIDLSGEKNIVIPGGVILASGRGGSGTEGALLYSHTMFAPADLDALFVTGGDNVRITGLRLKGPSAEIGDHDYGLTGVANAIRSFHAGLNVDNCELWAWDKWAIWLYVSDQAHIAHNYIHHTRRNGYGYGVWVGGSGSEEGAVANIEANLFDFNRHSIGSSGHNNTWVARYNVQLEHSLKHDFDRHDNAYNEGGASTIAMNNLFLHDGANIMWDGVPFESMKIENNWFVAEESKAVEVRDGVIDQNYFSSGNTFLFDPFPYVPAAHIELSIEEGVAPLAVQFDGSNSSDPTGQEIVNYRWQFNDSAESIHEAVESPVATHQFESPGVYNVELLAFNENGVPGRTKQTVVVWPEYSGYYVSAWIKDTYQGALEGHYILEVVVDGEVAWQEDVSGDEGWQHIFIDISELVLDVSEAELAFRIRCDKPITDPESQIIELHVYIDDVYVLGGSLGNNDFESSGDWKARTAGLGSWSTGTRSEEARSGRESYQLRSAYGKTRESGDFVELWQTISLDEQKDMLPGDVSGNNIVDEDDAMDIIKHIVRISSLQGVQYMSADVSGNGTVTIYDASLVMMYLSGHITCFPVESNCVTQ